MPKKGCSIACALSACPKLPTSLPFDHPRWQQRASLAHVLRRRFLRDPEWRCLPLPPLRISDEGVLPSQNEALSAQVGPTTP